MLAELAAFTAAAKTVAKCIQAGRELSSVATSIGKMAESKDALQTRLSKKKKEPFSTETEFEEFMALEEIRQREEDLLNSWSTKDVLASRMTLLSFKWKTGGNVKKLNSHRRKPSRKETNSYSL